MLIIKWPRLDYMYNIAVEQSVFCFVFATSIASNFQLVVDWEASVGFTLSVRI